MHIQFISIYYNLFTFEIWSHLLQRTHRLPLIDEQTAGLVAPSVGTRLEMDLVPSGGLDRNFRAIRLKSVQWKC